MNKLSMAPFLQKCHKNWKSSNIDRKRLSNKDSQVPVGSDKLLKSEKTVDHKVKETILENGFNHPSLLKKNFLTVFFLYLSWSSFSSIGQNMFSFVRYSFVSNRSVLLKRSGLLASQIFVLRFSETVNQRNVMHVLKSDFLKFWKNITLVSHLEKGEECFFRSRASLDSTKKKFVNNSCASLDQKINAQDLKIRSYVEEIRMTIFLHKSTVIEITVTVNKGECPVMSRLIKLCTTISRENE